MALRDVLSEYERIRANERKALNERIERAEQREPRLKAIAKQRRQLILQLAQAVHDTDTFEEVERRTKLQLDALDREARRLLHDAGLPEDDLQLHYRCPICKDTGYVGDTVREECNCLKQARLKQLGQCANINENETFMRFDEAVFPNERQRRRMHNARRLCEAYADGFPKTDTENLLLIGAPGLGKTFLLNCILERVTSRGFTANKVTAYNLIGSILKGIKSGEDAVAPYLSVELLLIDDLGSEPMMQNITREYLFSILNERRNSAQHTVVATNLSYQELQEGYGERVFSRLIDTACCKVLRLEGENLRLSRRPE